MKTVLITGATSGIGQACARLFAQHKYQVILCGRREDRLAELQDELSALTNVCTLNFDVSKKKAVSNAISSLPADFLPIDILINNAGNAHGFDPIYSGHDADWDAMIDTNVKGLLYVSKEIIPQMMARKSGHIINIGSVAGKEVYPKGNVYCASKFAVDALNQGMRMDLAEFGIRVGAIHPGMVETEFSEVRFKGDKARAAKVYEGVDALQPQDIADIIYFVVTRPYHINITDLVVLCAAQTSATSVHRS